MHVFFALFQISNKFKFVVKMDRHLVKKPLKTDKILGKREAFDKENLELVTKTDENEAPNFQRKKKARQNITYQVLQSCN
jgi:hypothetical protein